MEIGLKENIFEICTLEIFLNRFAKVVVPSLSFNCNSEARGKIDYSIVLLLEQKLSQDCPVSAEVDLDDMEYHEGKLNDFLLAIGLEAKSKENLACTLVLLVEIPQCLQSKD